MKDKVRVWLDGNHEHIHHATATQLPGMESAGAVGATDCGREGLMTLVHHENVDAGILCPDCVAVSGVRPPLAGQHLGPV